MKTNLKWNLASRLVGSCLALVLAIVLTGCDALSERLGQRAADTPPSLSPSPIVDNALSATSGSLFEVNTPAAISRLTPSLAKYQPQVEILSPKFDEVLTDDNVTVKLKVDNLPLFKSALGLGNHLHVILDKQPYQGVYDLNQPLVLKNLSPGTHSLRVFVSRPWHESFKNDGAYDRVTFHVLTKTAENNPDPQKPLLTYSRPAGTYGAEPIMLDYYLTNAPSHPASDKSEEQISDWRIRVTINDQRFILDRWTPVYLQGFKRGKNLVKMELLDDLGNPIPNVYNDNISFFTYDPQQQDTLAKLVTGKLDPNLALALVDPSHIANKSLPTPTVAVLPTTTPIATPIPSTSPSAQPAPSAIVPSPQPIARVPQVSATTEPDRSADRPLAANPQPPVSLAPSSQPAPTAKPTISTPTIQPTQAPTAKPTPSAIAVAPAPTPKVAPNIESNNTKNRQIEIPSSGRSANETQPQIVPAAQPTAAPLAKPVPSTIIPVQPLPVVPVQQPIANDPQSPTVTTPIIQPTAAPIVPVQPSIPPVAVAPTPSAPTQSSIPPVTAVPTVPTPQPSIAPIPQPIAMPQSGSPTFPPAPKPEAATNPEHTNTNDRPLVKPIPSPIVTTPNPPSPPLPLSPSPTAQITPSWQTRAIELFDLSRSKIRQFTNTIPGKAQRFARNLKTWTGYAIDKIQEFRAAQNQTDAT